MGLFLEIICVAAAVLVLVGTAVGAGRQAMGLGRTARHTRDKVLPRVDSLMGGADTAQRRGLAITERVARLQERVFVLGSTARRMWVLLAALKQARDRVSPALRYIGL